MKLKIFITMTAVSIIAACGSDGGTDGDSNTTATPDVYKFLVLSGGELATITKASPDTAANVTTDGTTAFIPATSASGGEAIMGAVYGGSVSGDQISGLHPRAYIVHDTNSLYKVNALTSGTTVLSQISSETGMNAYCPGTTDVYPDMATPDNSVIVYELQTGADCNTTSRNAITLGTAVGVAPVTAPKIHEAIYASNGAISGFLVENANALEKLSGTDLTATATAITYTGAGAVSGLNKLTVVAKTASSMLVYVEDGGTNDGLYYYDVTGTTLSSITTTYDVNTSVNVLVDASNMYFSEGTGIYKLALDGSAETNIATLGSAPADGSIYQSDSHLVYDAGANLQVVAKASTTVTAWTTLAHASASSITNSTIENVSGDWVYYQSGNTAGMIKTDNSAATEIDGTVTFNFGDSYEGAEWYLGTLNTSGLYHNMTSGNLGYSHIFLVHATGSTLGSTPTVFTVSSYDTRTGTKVADITTISTNAIGDFTAFNFVQSNIPGSHTLGIYQNGFGTAFRYSIDATSADSLVKITNGNSATIM